MLNIDGLMAVATFLFNNYILFGEQIMSDKVFGRVIDDFLATQGKSYWAFDFLRIGSENALNGEFAARRVV